MENNSHVKNIKGTEFVATFEDYLKNHTEFIVIIKGGKEENGEYWCGDCTRATPAINTIIIPKAGEANIPVLIVDGGNRQEFRAMKVECDTTLIKLERIPSLFWISEGSIEKTIIEKEFVEHALVASIFEE